MKLIQFPIIKIIPWFLLGIVIGYYFSPAVQICLLLLLISIGFLGFLFLKTNSTFVPNKFFGMALSLVFFFLGLTNTVFHKENTKPNHYSHFLNYGQKQGIKATIVEKLKSTTKNHRYIARVRHIDKTPVFGKVIINSQKSDSDENLKIGNTFLLHETILPNLKPNNPNQFDYSKYLETKNIFGQIYTDNTRIKVSTQINKDYNYYASNFRNTIIENLRNSGFDNQELAVITALILGQQQEISKEVLQDYQYAGAVHILSVSGLHVGFILLFITFLLKPIPNSTLGNTSKLILTIIGLWLFALIAGLAPSVVRSTVMFSFLAIGVFLNRETNKYHTVLVSMFLILLVEPMFLFDIGFQLSYSAVFALLWLQPILSKLWEPKNSFSKYVWGLLTVSFSAQIGTLPISIYYFHQFPSLFFITNLVLIPVLEFIIMPLGVILMLLAYFNWIPLWFSKSIEFSIKMMNAFINKVASTEDFILKDIPLSLSMMVVLYFIIFQFFLWFQKPKFRSLTLFFIGIVAFQFLLIYEYLNQNVYSEFIVFNSMKKTIIGEKSGNQIIVKSNDSIIDNSFEKSMLSTYATSNFSTFKLENNLINVHYINKKKVLIIDESNIWQSHLQPEVLLLSHSPKINLDRILQSSKPKIVIADASNYKSYVALWKATCLKRKIPFHSTYEKGFYRIK